MLVSSRFSPLFTLAQNATLAQIVVLVLDPTSLNFEALKGDGHDKIRPCWAFMKFRPPQMSPLIEKMPHSISNCHKRFWPRTFLHGSSLFSRVQL